LKKENFSKWPTILSRPRIFIQKNHCFLVTADERRFTRTFCSADLAEQKNAYGQGEKQDMEINDITYAINGAAFEVNRVPGPGFLEKVCR